MATDRWAQGPYWGMKMFSKWVIVMVVHFSKFTKKHLIVQLKWVSLWSINYGSIKFF